MKLHAASRAEKLRRIGVIAVILHVSVVHSFKTQGYKRAKASKKITQTVGELGLKL
jgi:hypothetical protein